MSLSSLLLRVVLAALLVFNGTAGAATSVRMAMQHDAATQRASEVPASCHDTDGNHAIDPMSPSPDEVPSMPDCCDTETCAFTCAQHCSAVTVHAAGGDVLPPVAVTMTPPADGHPEPLQPGLIRPPIHSGPRV